LAVVIKGVSCSGARRLATHLMRTDTNERAEVKELRGVVAEDLQGALLEMEAVAAGTRTTKPFYHASINTRAEEKLTDKQRIEAIDELEKKLGLTDQARVIVVHEKEGREHCHVVWSRIDLERMASISDSHNYRKHEEVARELERKFGHERVQGAHAERDGKDRPDRTPSHAEMLATERGAVSAEEAKQFVTAVWQTSKNGEEFKETIEAMGWKLARGDRRDFVVLDPEGGTHSLARRIEGAKAKDIRERMADIDPASLPSVAEARTMQRAARQQLEGQRTPAAELVSSARDGFQPEANPFTAELQRMARADAAKLRDPNQTPIERRFAEGAREAANDIRQQRREDKFWADQDAWQGRRHQQAPRSAGPGPAGKGLRVVDGVTGVVSGLGDFMVDLLAGSPARPDSRRPDMAAFVNDPAARKQQQLDRLAAKRQGENEWQALERIREDMQAGRNLKAEDIRALTRQHQEQIATFGDSAVRQMVDDARRASERYWKGGERERE
jgi:hypothetical protein